MTLAFAGIGNTTPISFNTWKKHARSAASLHGKSNPPTCWKPLPSFTPDRRLSRPCLTAPRTICASNRCAASREKIDGDRQDAVGANPCPHLGRSLYDCRCHDLDRGRVCGRGRREYYFEAPSSRGQIG